MAAGSASRFVPLSAEIPKGLLEVKGEILIERQIKQLKEAGVEDITIVVGYMAEQFMYLKDKHHVNIVMNTDYHKYNNTSSIIKVLDKLADTYICSSDNYFVKNVFKENPQQSYYSSLYTKGSTDEYCLSVDDEDNIINVTIGGHDSWYMIGHVYFSKDFSEKFKTIMGFEYQKESTRYGYWEDVYIRYLSILPKMKIHRYGKEIIREFDSIDELRTFDESYICDTRSSVLKHISSKIGCKESSLSCFRRIPHSGDYLLFSFQLDGNRYKYNEYDDSIILL